ncbi:THO complex subunit 5 homolog [Schistocerca piceifrons]|uniref:THO complex subunit 5 homolog n=1 Tax=Schistocerca piceifrons TaxID=274613 RepID=UPI001F5F36C7|nr:THO complex subunit 5 homolog [Schistocerca piceifrons]
MNEKDNIPPKKRRKGTSGASSGSVKVSDGDIYKNVIEFEETEVQLRDATYDRKRFYEICDEYRNLMVEISELKTQGSQAADKINEKRIQGCLLFVLLKKLNRLEKFRTKHSRETLYKAKQQLDSYHLQLQNLLYEILHVKKEVTKCLQFKSKDEEIELVSVEEFYKTAPESITRLELTQNDMHQLKLARLEWELEQRKQLAALCHKLQGDKELVAKEIQKKRELLDNLTPRLKTILEATKPLQDYLGLPLDRIRKQHEISYLLPKPLYVLYVQVDAYREACDPLMTVAVNGDEEEARSLKQSLAESETLEESDSDQEDTTEFQNRHHRKLSKIDRMEERKKRLLLRHPLSVEIVIKQKDGNSLSLNFSYLVNLHVVTVKPQVNLSHAIHGICAGDLIAPQNILSSLFPSDLGLDSPNVANLYQLQHMGLDGFGSYISDLGIPYIWAQNIAGLDFTGSKSHEIMEAQPKTAVSQACVENVMRGIRQRLKARLALCCQLQALETGVVSVPHTLRKNFPAKLCCTLSSWQPVTWEEYKSAVYTATLVKENFVTHADSFYVCVLTRGTAKLVSLIAIKCDYPRIPPIFCLQLLWHGEHNSTNNDAVRDMEKELNTHWMELIQGRSWGQTLLMCQIMRLMSCFDVFLEASGATGIAPPEFPRDKIFLKPVKGRNRCRPYKYLQLGGGIFTQR